MIGMFVGDQDAVEAFRGAANRGEPLADLAGAEPGIDEQSRLVRFKVRAIAAGTAAQDGESCRHALTLGRDRGPGNCFGGAMRRRRRPIKP